MKKYRVIEEKIFTDTAFDFDNHFKVAQAGQLKTELAYVDRMNGAFLYHGNCLSIMDAISVKHPNGCFDMVFVDPPYFLSNGGITCHAGKMVKVDKGAWDKSRGSELNHEFNTEWLKRCQRLLKPNGTLWVSGSMHAIYSIGFAMQQLGFKILNNIIWEKPNPPPNLSHRYFTHSTETVLWAAKNAESRHIFNYSEMKIANGGKQMKSVWRVPPPGRSEKTLGKHPTQKPVALVMYGMRRLNYRKRFNYVMRRLSSNLPVNFEKR